MNRSNRLLSSISSALSWPSLSKRDFHCWHSCCALLTWRSTCRQVSVCLPIYLSIYLSACLSIYLSIYLSASNLLFSRGLLIDLVAHRVDLVLQVLQLRVERLALLQLITVISCAINYLNIY